LGFEKNTGSRREALPKLIHFGGAGGQTVTKEWAEHAGACHEVRRKRKVG